MAHDNGARHEFGARCREYIRVGFAPASSAMDGANGDYAGALIGPAGEGHCNKHQIHALRVSGTAMTADFIYAK